MSFLLPLARQRALLRSSLSHCELLQGELKGITAPSFSAQATFIAGQLSLLVEHVAGVLQAQQGKRHSGGRLERARKIDHLLRRVHLLARGLRQSHPSDCPPTAQFFVDSLLDHFLPHLKEQQRILVSATQTYRWGCLDVWRFLEESLDVSDLLGEGPQGGAAPGDLPTLQGLLGVVAGKPPPRCAILGLAQLDAPDPLLFPLLAHELGHLEEFHRDPAWTRALLAGRGESKKILKFASFCAQELLCDLIASRMMGITYLCALHHFFSITEVDFRGARTILPDPPAHAEEPYPSPSFRLRLILDRAHSARDALRDGVFHELAEALDRDLPRMDDFARPSSGSDATAVEQVIRDILPRIEEIASEIIPQEKVAGLPGHLPRLIRELKAGIPPLHTGVERATAQGINDVICAGWHLRLRGESDTNTDILVDKSIELSDLLKPGSDLEQEDLSAWSGAPVPSQRGVLSSSTLRSHLAPTGVDARSTAPEPRPEEGAGQEAPARSAPGDGRIRITPIISKKAVGPGRPQSPIQAASYELHLGNWFKVAHRTRYPFVSLAEKEDRLLALREWHSEYYVRRNEDFILHPQDFALACSIEFIALPDNIMALVDGKSGLGRMGLSIATAAQVAPGFHGSLVLELFNVGTLPLKLRPGMAVAQLVFLTTDQPVPDEHLYRGSFRYQLRP